MLPVVTADIRESVEQAIEANPDEWKREMIHHIKEENPELNSLLLTMAHLKCPRPQACHYGWLYGLQGFGNCRGIRTGLIKGL
ncbi:MAG: hypothetical protein R2857_00070 [Vampirovibrionales bacterium]